MDEEIRMQTATRQSSIFSLQYVLNFIHFTRFGLLMNLIQKSTV